MKVWNLSEGGEGSDPKSKLFGINLGSTEKKFWGMSLAINTYFWI